jgi:hypothetical protein
MNVSVCVWGLHFEMGYLTMVRNTSFDYYVLLRCWISLLTHARLEEICNVFNLVSWAQPYFF